jgi:hypothetical protein
LERFGAVRASKLLARKRPRLIPIYDQVVACVLGFGSANGTWKWTFDALSANEQELVKVLNRIRELASTKNPRISEVSILRVLDVVIWMDHVSVHPTGYHPPLCPSPRPWGLG